MSLSFSRFEINEEIEIFFRPILLPSRVLVHYVLLKQLKSSVGSFSFLTRFSGF